jgi:AcrR family transcriptional regulator
MFARNGYSTVSIRDIANQVGIRPSSLYNHFSSKEQLFDEILDTIINVYNDYYLRLDEKIYKANSFEEMVDALFAELKDVYHMFIYYGVVMIVTEQFRDARVRNICHDIYMRRGVEYMTKAFDRCIEEKWVKPFDSQAVSYMIMNSVATGSLVRALEDMGCDTVYSSTEMFKRIEKLLLDLISAY